MSFPPDEPRALDLRSFFAARKGGPLPEAAARVLEAMPRGDARARRFHAIRERLFEQATWVKRGDFDQICQADLELLFDFYDECSFHGALRELLPRPWRPGFRFSRRMRRTGGNITTYARYDPFDGVVVAHHEIALSAPILCSVFSENSEPVRVAGLPCHDRLAVLQRIFEHQLVHLFELLVTGRSRCSESPFRGLARHLFGHRRTNHRDDLRPSPLWIDIQPGDHVRFRHRGEMLEGVVRRITVRATVFVPRRGGYTYRKFYVPLPDLERIAPA